MIAEAAYQLAEKRGFLGEHSLDDWLAAEQQVRQVISEVTMNDISRQNEPKPEAKTLQATATAGQARLEDPSPQSKPEQATHRSEGISRFEKFAATQAAGDGIQGDVLKPAKTVGEKLGANMADRK